MRMSGKNPWLWALGLLLLPVALPSCHRSSGRDGSATTILKDVAFSTREEIPVKGDGPMGLAVVDVDGDSNLDLVVANVVTGTLQVIVSDTGGGFSVDAGATLSVPGGPMEVVSGDFNDDGKADLAALRLQVGKVSVFVGDGLGGFGSAPAVELNAGKNPSTMVAADLDGDLNDDLLIADAGNHGLIFYKGDGKGGFGTAIEIPFEPGCEPVALAVADFDQDGINDVAVGDLTRGKLTVRTLTKPGETVVISGPAFTGITAVDVDGNGYLDIVGASAADKKVHVALNSATGWLPGILESTLSSRGYCVRSGDLNNDYKADLVVTYMDEMSMAIMHGDGTGKFVETAVLPATGLPFRCEVLDVTGDGNLDILASASMAKAISLYRGLGGDVVGGRCFGEDLVEPFFVVSTDLNGDGLADLAYSDRAKGEVTIMEAKGGSFVLISKIDVGTYAGNLVKGDFDADGFMDLAVALNDGVRILKRGAGPGFNFTLVPPLTQPPFQTGPGPFEVLAADLDLDGIPELLTADYGGESLTLLKGQAGMSFVPLQMIQIKDGPMGMASGDFDGDGKLDVALSRYKAARLVLLGGKGDGTLNSPTEITVDPYPNYVRAGDLNKDGRTDLVVSNLGGSAVTVLLHDNGFVFSLMKIAAGEQPSALLTDDLNHDGNMDVLVATVETGDFRVLVGDGQGGFSATLRFPGVRGAASADLGDINGDGKKDLVIGSIFNRRVTLFTNISK